MRHGIDGRWPELVEKSMEILVPDLPEPRHPYPDDLPPPYLFAEWVDEKRPYTDMIVGISGRKARVSIFDDVGLWVPPDARWIDEPGTPLSLWFREFCTEAHSRMLEMHYVGLEAAETLGAPGVFFAAADPVEVDEHGNQPAGRRTIGVGDIFLLTASVPEQDENPGPWPGKGEAWSLSAEESDTFGATDLTWTPDPWSFAERRLGVVVTSYSGDTVRAFAASDVNWDVIGTTEEAAMRWLLAGYRRNRVDFTIRDLFTVQLLHVIAGIEPRVLGRRRTVVVNP